MVSIRPGEVTTRQGRVQCETVIVTVDGRQVRGFSYQGDSERALKMRLAREFIEGWVEGAIHSARWDAA